MRLIDADALLQALEIEIHKKYPFSLKDLITNAPTIEADSGEPVAYIVKLSNAASRVLEFELPKHGWEFLGSNSAKITPLYTAQPQKQWVGLSDDDFKDTSWFTDEFIEGANWAQNKLKELNHGS